MPAARRFVIENWTRHRDKVMYLIVGGWNTLVYNGLFFVLYYFLRDDMGPSVILAIAYGIASINGYLTFRYLVFGPVRHPVIEYLRYQAVYLPILAINLVVLPLALTYTNLNAYVVQVLFAVFAVVAAYIGNKHFAFRQPKPDR